MRQKKNSMLSFAWTHAKGMRGRITLFFLLSLPAYLTDITTSVIIGAIVDMLIDNPSRGTIYFCCACVIAVRVVFFFLTFYRRVEEKQISLGLGSRISRALLKHLYACADDDIEEKDSSVLLQRIQENVDNYSELITGLAGMIPGTTFLVAVILLLIMYYNIVCGVVSMIGLGVFYWLSRQISSKLDEAAAEQTRYRGIFFSRLKEMVGDLKLIKTDGLYDRVADRFNEASLEMMRIQRKRRILGFLMTSLTIGADGFIQIFLFFYGSYAVLKGDMTIGQFTTIFNLMTYLAMFFTQLTMLKDWYIDGKADYENVRKIADIPEQTRGGNIPGEINQIKAENVSFSYGDVQVLSNISYSFKKGHIYGICGENGSGKSTLVDVLLGLHIDHYEGNVLYNDCPVETLDMQTVRQNMVGVCEQEPNLLSDTVRYNMILSERRDSEVDAELHDLSKKVSLDEFIRTSDEGLDIQVGEGGSRLSGGQKQKVALVGAFYKDPELLILDEPTSAMDREGRERLIGWLDEYKENKIILIVSHDRDLLGAADEIIRM